MFGSQHSSKRRREEVGEGMDWSGKKKGRSDAERVAAEFKKRGMHLCLWFLSVRKKEEARLC